MEKHYVIKTICNNLGLNKANCINVINSEYPFIPIVKVGSRDNSEFKRTKIFLRDCFIDRYSGNKLVFPPVLRIISNAFPNEFPYQAHWAMDKCHISYWELTPTLDHVVPIARGGTNCEDNIVCTSMLKNSIKSNFTLEEVGWSLHPSGNILEWDGMVSWYVEYIEKHPSLLEQSYFSTWHKAVIKCLDIN